jgi:hypothetical protein
MAYRNDEIELPKGYHPYPELVICSNVLANVAVPFRVRDFPVLLVGRAELPLVWLGAPIDPLGEEWEYVVEANRAISPVVRLKTDSKSCSVTIQLGSHLVITVRASNQTSAIINHLDLRPIGLNVHGNEKTLAIAGTTLTQNTIKDVYVAFSLDRRKSPSES